MSEELNKLLNDAVLSAVKERGRINILIAGRSGVGKSTLINSVFQKNLAETGQGRPVTKGIREISREDVPISIFDTRGLEMSEFKETISGLERLIKERCDDQNPNRHIHAAWLCIQEDGRRVEDAEIELHNMLSQHVPLITVITKARSDVGFRSKVIELLPKSRNVLRVRAISEELDGGIILNPSGLEELVELTSEVIPEGRRRAFAAAQKASINYKKNQAHKVVAAAALAAGTAGASPIPFSDAALLAPIQIGMIAKITSVFGFELSKSTLGTLVTSAIGVGGATFAGRAIVTNVLKLIPGAGTVAGGVISAATASVVTTGLGEAYIAVLADFAEENPNGLPSASELAEKLKKKILGIN
ncbi:GTP-binding protein [Lysobacteraceae bacterium NML07-0707]|nr:GTP-binding protein [Xanthomonadaceae bacterium NML07-0707]